MVEVFVFLYLVFDGWWWWNDKDSYENSYKDFWGRGDLVNGYLRYGKFY